MCCGPYVNSAAIKLTASLHNLANADALMKHDKSNEYM